MRVLNGDYVTIVSGLPRSGTSLMMQMLAAGGIPALTDNLRPADESNPRGYFEFEPVKRLRSDRSWLDQARGHAVKIIHVLVRELPADGQFHYRLLLMKRPIEEILASQRAMLERQGKTSADEATLAKIFRTQLDQLEKWLAAQPAFSFLAVDYRRVLKEPLEVAREVARPNCQWNVAGNSKASDWITCAPRFTEGSGYQGCVESGAVSVDFAGVPDGLKKSFAGRIFLLTLKFKTHKTDSVIN